MTKPRKAKVESADVEKLHAKSSNADAPTSGDQGLPDEKEEKDTRNVRGNVRFRKRISMQEADEEGLHRPVSTDPANLSSCLRDAAFARTSTSDGQGSRKGLKDRSPTTPTRRGKRKNTITADTGATSEECPDVVDQQLAQPADLVGAIPAGSGGGTGSWSGPESGRESPGGDRSPPQIVFDAKDVQPTSSPPSTTEGSSRKGAKALAKENARANENDSIEPPTSVPKLVLPCCICSSNDTPGLFPAWLFRR